jgi:hypothetical protein
MCGDAIADDDTGGLRPARPPTVWSLLSFAEMNSLGDMPAQTFAELSRRSVGEVVPLRLKLSWTSHTVIIVDRFLAFTTGISFHLSIWVPLSDEMDVRGLGLLDAPVEWRVAARRGEVPDQLLQFGVEFSDGTRRYGHHGGLLADHGLGPLLDMDGGSYGATSSDTRWVIAPLPPAGPMTFLCAWPIRGVSPVRASIDTNVFLTAASRAEPLPLS